ncbi:MAG: hypothetical protein KC549_15175, partial [Myxococcales bacterium]|nr:hypothetical protein [Myxococcales bacterium]
MEVDASIEACAPTSEPPSGPAACATRWQVAGSCRPDPSACGPDERVDLAEGCQPVGLACPAVWRAATGRCQPVRVAAGLRP